MNDLQIFENTEFGKVRIIQIDGEPWFVAHDVARALGYRMASDMTRNIDLEDKGTQKVRTPGGPQREIVINESGLYAAILSSRIPSAKKFKRWVTSEVLPQIRRTGGYHLPQTYSEALRELADKTEEAERLKLENEEMKPKAVFADAVLDSDELILIRELAHIMRQIGIPTGERRLYDWMRDRGYICKHSTKPTQRAMEMGLFRVIEREIPTTQGEPPMFKPTTKVTVKGQQFFINKLKETS